MGKLTSFIANQKNLLRMQQELNQLRKENEKLRNQNDSMRSGMRRCVTCDYRLDYKQRQGSAPVLDQTSHPSQTSAD